MKFLFHGFVGFLFLHRAVVVVVVVVVVDDVVVVVVVVDDDVVVVVVDVNFPRGSERVADEAVSGHNFAINVQNGFTRMSLKKHQK